MIRYAATIFLSAFLLFQIQPLIARAILPWFGGTAAVWTTCLMFFQIVLLLGYAYAHLLNRLLTPRLGWLWHSVLLGIAACFANVLPDAWLQPAGDENLTLAILKLLTLTVGLPFFTLASTSPLIQAWQHNSHADRSPYRLYALSNLGSVLALLTFPFVFERWLSLEQQVLIWRLSFLAFCGLCFLSGLQQRSLHSRKKSDFEEAQQKSAATDSAPIRNALPIEKVVAPIVWLILSMAASILLLATTNLMCQEVASVPFLWILPLTLYLLSFIVCFDRPAWYRRRIWLPLLVISSIVSIVIVHLNVHAGFLLQIGSLATVLLAACMTCHGELERLKPAPEKLTWFYLLVSVGGSLGGIFVAVIAPRWFNGFYEFQIGLLICLMVPMVILLFPSGKQPAEIASSRSKYARYLMAGSMSLAATIVLCSLVFFLDPSYHADVIFATRNEYGLVSVTKDETYLKFINGRIEHGAQFSDETKNLEHSSYYRSGSGVAIAFETMRNYKQQSSDTLSLEVGVLGLGAGGMMTWGATGDRFTFYEINPAVKFIAEHHFSFLKDSPAESEVELGDGRLQLERRARANKPRFDLLFMDAFASDSIPLHLLTTESFDVYLSNLQPDGILIAHITNRFVDLRPVIFQLASEHELTPLLIDCETADGDFETRWVLLTRNEAIIQSPLVTTHQTPWPSDLQPIRWTDDHASLVDVLNWSGNIDWPRIQAPRSSD